MINTKYVLGFIISSLVFVGCQKVINIDLKDAEPVIVIEGMLNEGDSLHTIIITKSLKFSDSNSFPAVKGAVVSLSDDEGNSEILTEVADGKYQTTQFKLKGMEGRTYTLQVQTDGKTFIAKSKMPKRVVLDSIFFIDDSFSNKGAKTPIPIMLDPVNEQNNYRFDLYLKRATDSKGWIRDSAIKVNDDFYSNGVITQFPLFTQLGNFLPKDSLRIEMNCIDRNVFTYFYSLSLNGPGGSATPANPISNFSGGCLGYFSAQTKQIMQVVVE